MEKTKPDFRIKVDLSKFFQDNRRTSWIFVDSSRLLYIKHLKEHIAQLFHIKEPFFLICDSTYLPFNEDIRILHNDNFVTLVPGTLVDNSSNSIGEWHPANSLKENISQLSSAQASTFDEKEVQTDRDDQLKLSNSPSRDITLKVPSDDAMPEPKTANTTMYHSILEESEPNSATESKATESVMTEDCSFDLNTPAKRKRVRRKRVKRLGPEPTSQQNSSLEDLKKPKIIDHIIIASGKHIRFNDPDEEITSPSSYNSGISEFPSRFCDTPGPKKPPSKDLNSLLTLKHCSTPLTFICKKTEKKFKMEKSPKSLRDEDVENLTESARNIVVPIEINENEKSNNFQIENIDPEKYPSLLTAPKVGDVVAFKLFKMAEDYTPQISNYIIGKIVAVHQITFLCTITVLRGHNEIQEPKGKLSLPADEAESPSDVIKLNFNQLLEPRLIQTLPYDE